MGGQGCTRSDYTSVRYDFKTNRQTGGMDQVAGSIPCRFDASIDFLRLVAAVFSGPNVSWLCVDVRDWGWAFRVFGSNNARSDGICASICGAGAGPNPIGVGIRYASSGHRLRGESKQGFARPLAWPRQLDHAGRPLFCSNRNDPDLARFPDLVSAASVSRAWVGY